MTQVVLIIGDYVNVLLFVCMGGDYEGDWITAIYDSREQAEQHLRIHADKDAEIRPTRIEEYALNMDDLTMRVEKYRHLWP